MYDEDTLSEIITAYGGRHWTVPYINAEAYAYHAKEYGATMNLARISQDAFELLSFHDEWRMDSEYVTLAVGRRLYQEGLVGVMVLWGNPEDEPTTQEEWNAREREQVYGDYAESL
jgi:hypothetical protein